MATTKKAREPKTGKYPPRKEVPCFTSGESADEVGQAFGRVITSPELAAGRIIQSAESKSLANEIDVPGLLDVLRERSAAVNRGDLSQAEVMLINQATALQTLFARLTEKAMGADYLSQVDSFMRLALKSQSQCVRTLEVLATIKNPPNVAFVKQANIAHGHQQVNNDVVTTAQAPSPPRSPPQAVENLGSDETELLYFNPPARAENENLQNELLSPATPAAL